MLSIEPFSERAQLLLLLAGLREAIVRAAEIEYECFRLLQQVGDLKAIVFEPSEQPDDRKVTRLTGERDERVQVLDKLILQFEREVSG